jgi:hypothetical protein
MVTMIQVELFWVVTLCSVASFLQSIKSDFSMKIQDVDSIPCECGKVFIGQTGCSIETGIKEHQYIRLYHVDHFSSPDGTCPVIAWWQQGWNG